MYYYYNGELYHHGVDGQKWGVRNGPPYPLERTASGAIKKKTKLKTIADLKSLDVNELQAEIEEKSGDWYNSNPKTEGFKKAIEHDMQGRQRYARLYAEYYCLNEACEKYQDELQREHIDYTKDKMYQKLSSEVKAKHKMYWDTFKQEVNRREQEATMVVLNDLGYEDTPEARQYLLDTSVIFWD